MLDLFICCVESFTTEVLYAVALSIKSISAAAAAAAAVS